MKSVVIFAEDYLPNIGGIATHVHNLAKGLTEAGVKTLVVISKKVRKRRNLFEWKVVKKNIDGVDVAEIPLMYSPKNILKGFQLKYRFAGFVNKQIKKNGATVFHWHNIYFDPEIAKWVNRSGLRKVFTNHSSQFLLAHKDSKNFKYNEAVLKMADEIIAPSTELKQATVRCGIPSNKVTFIPNGVYTDVFKPDEGKRIEYRNKLELDNGVIGIICPRRVVPKCGVIYLAKALKFIDAKAELKIFFTGLKGGDLTWRDEIYEREVIGELAGYPFNIKVVLLDQIPNREMVNYYRAMDICILPSLVEATSISALEAMATGLPVIATNVGGLPEIIENKRNGLLVDAKDEEQLARKISLLASNEELRRELGGEARNRMINEFDWNIIIKKTMKVYFS